MEKKYQEGKSKTKNIRVLGKGDKLKGGGGDKLKGGGGAEIPLIMRNL